MAAKSLASAAEWYATRRKWFVIPLHNPVFDGNGQLLGCSCEPWRRANYDPGYVCKTPGKHPRLKNWEAEASNDPATVRRWWKRWPQANVGIAAGKSGLLAFDLDLYKDDYDGGDLLTPADEETITNLTGSGGAHLIYAMPPDALLTNATGTLPKGIDIRGWGGQFVAPPSLHPSGRLYQWETGYGPHERDPLPLPDALRDLLEQATQAPDLDVTFGEPSDKPPDLTRWRLSRRIVELIENAPGANDDRSANDQSVITALVKAGASNDDIRAVFDHYPIGREGKYAEKGRHALAYLAHSIAHARGWMHERRTEEIEQRAIAFVAMAIR